MKNGGCCVNEFVVWDDMDVELRNTDIAFDELNDDLIDTN